MFSSADIGAKFFLNGFPKAGLHLVEGLIKPLAAEQKSSWPVADKGHVEVSWVPYFKDNAWSLEKERPELTLFALGRVKDGHYLKGHLGYEYRIEEFIYWSGIIHIFIYRDLRDVAVSIAHELWYKKGQPGLSTKLGMSHPGKEEFRAMNSFDDVLSAVIAGHGKYPGVIARWARYWYWIPIYTPRSICVLQFEQAVEDPFAAADTIIDHTLAHLNRILGLEFNFLQSTRLNLIKDMALSSKDTDKSVTFRGGRVGDWKECFTEKHVEEFKASDPYAILVQLGYEQNEDWTI